MYKWVMATIVSFAGLLAVILLLTGLPEKTEFPLQDHDFIVPEYAVDAEASMQIYKSRCISCHAADLKGGGGPALEHIGSVLTKEQIYKLVSNGRGRMPAFKERLSEEEIITITTWLSSLQ